MKLTDYSCDKFYKPGRSDPAYCSCKKGKLGTRKQLAFHANLIKDKYATKSTKPSKKAS